jgi:hypothetical protein
MSDLGRFIRPFFCPQERDSIRYEKGGRCRTKTNPHPPILDLGLRTRQRRIVKHTLKVSYLKIAFSDCLLYHLSAGKVFALRSNLSSPRFSPCLHLKKKVSPQKFFSKKKYFRFFPSTFLQINKRVPYPPKFFLYFLKFGMLE